MPRYSVASEDFVQTASFPNGIVKDTWIDEGNPTYNYGASGFLNLGFLTDGAGNPIALKHIILEVKMPEDDDILGFGELISAILKFKVSTSTVTGFGWFVLGVVAIEDDFDEGSQSGSAGWANWTQYIDSVAWSRASGACASNIRSGYDEIDGTVFDTFRILSGGSYTEIELDLTEAMDMGDLKRFAIFILASDTLSATDSCLLTLYSNEASLANRPVLEITYKDYILEAFESKDDALTIEPNPDNPEQPLLKWGGVSDNDFVNFKLYRETSPITSVALLTPIATIVDNSDQEYIDTASLTDGNTYYYMVIAEDLSNTGDSSTKSKNVSFTKPSMTTRLISPSGLSTVGSTKSVTVTSSQNIKRLFVDWKDNVESWYEYEYVGTSKSASHIYMIPVATFSPDVRIEDELGFWSSLQATTNTAQISDGAAAAKLLIGERKAIVGETITLNGTLSRPKAANATITKYEFKRDASDSWQDNGADPIYQFNSGTYPGTVGVKTASLRVTTSTGITSATTQATYELETGTPLNITPGESGGLASGTQIHSLEHVLRQNKSVDSALGADKTAKEFVMSIDPERMSVSLTSFWGDYENDVTLIRTIWDSNTYFRLEVKDEKEDKIIQYDCKLDGDITLGHRFDNKINWSFPVRVVVRTEVDDTPKHGDITSYAAFGGSKTSCTSNGHGLIDGQYVLITGSVNYNGTWQVSDVTTNTFKIAKTFVSNDGIGLWRKVGE